MHPSLSPSGFPRPKLRPARSSKIVAHAFEFLKRRWTAALTSKSHTDALSQLKSAHLPVSAYLGERLQGQDCEFMNIRVLADRRL